MELWHGLVGYHEAFLPKKGDLVVYFPQGHLEYADLFRSLKQSSVVEAPSFGLQPEVVCRVVHVQLIVSSEVLSLMWVLCYAILFFYFL